MSRSLIALLTVVVLLASCGSDDGEGLDLGEQLRGREFWSVSVLENGAERTLVEDTRIIVRFDETGTGIGVSAGCNQIGGSIEFDGSTLVTSDLFSTEMGCDPERHAQDEFIIGVLGSRPTVAFDDTEFGGPEFGLETDTVAIRFLDAEVANPDQPIIGTAWTVTGFEDTQAATAFSVARDATLEFPDESTVRGFDGCAEFEGSAEVADGSTGGPVEGDGEFQFGPIDWVPIAECDEPDYVEMVRRVFDAGSASFTISGTNLRIVTSDGIGLTARAG